MTRKQALAAIRAAGMSGRYSPEWGEWRVTYPASELPSAERREAVAVYCSDNQEAADNAAAMRRHAEQHGVK